MRLRRADAEGHRVSTILVVQPDHAQAKVLHDVAHRVGAQLVIVDSTARAVDAIGRQIPDLILLSALLSPRDEDTLMARLRSLDGASHLQTLTLPQFQAAESTRSKKSGFGFRKKQKAAAPVGADPVAFGEEIVTHLAHAHEIRSRPAPVEPVRSVVAPAIDLDDVAAIEAFAESETIAASEPVASTEAEAEYEPIAEYESVIAPDPEPLVYAEPIVETPTIAEPEPSIEVEPVAEMEPIAVASEIEAPIEEPVDSPFIGLAAVEPLPESSTDEDEIDKLVRQLGLDVKLVEIEEIAPPAAAATAETSDEFDFGAALDRARIEADERRSAEFAQLQADAEAIRTAAIAEARATAEREAREALAADLARVQAEAEEMREIAIAEARAVAEREARETLNAELARVRSETEVTVADALNRVKVEAEEAERARAEAERMRVEAQEAFAAELARVRAEVEQKLSVQLEAARTEAERMRAAEAAAVRERTAVEAQLKSELDRLRFAAAQTRKADESETRKAAEQIKRLEGELAQVRAKAEERQVAELEEIRVQMAEMREAAARHVRDAAAEAVAAEVARATAHTASASPVSRPTAVIAQFPSREVARIEPEEEAVEQAGRDYLSLWQSKKDAPPAVEDVEDEDDESDEETSYGTNLRRHAKWVLPIAACLLLVTSTGTAISTVARFVRPAEPPPPLTVEPVEVEPFIEVVEKRVGRLQVESTPSGAEALVDGRSYGKTPITIPSLEVGNHTLVLKSGAGTITRRVSIKANETTRLAEAIFSGWLAIFSPFPVAIVVDGKPVSLTDDGRLMVSPGRHRVELISERFGYRVTETLEVRPGETTPHTLTVPMGSVRVQAPDGVEILVDGQPASGVPAEGLAVAIGSHEISARHPELGERRVAVDVRHGDPTDVTLRFDQ